MPAPDRRNCDQDVDATEALDRGRTRRADARGVVEVHRDGEHLGTGLVADLLRGRLRAPGGPGADRARRALSRRVPSPMPCRAPCSTRRRARPCPLALDPCVVRSRRDRRRVGVFAGRASSLLDRDRPFDSCLPVARQRAEHWTCRLERERQPASPSRRGRRNHMPRGFVRRARRSRAQRSRRPASRSVRRPPAPRSRLVARGPVVACGRRLTLGGRACGRAPAIKRGGGQWTASRRSSSREARASSADGASSKRCGAATACARRSVTSHARPRCGRASARRWTPASASPCTPRI